jgi:hypothetical protein
MKLQYRLIFGLFLTSVACAASAGTIVCSGKVLDIGYHQPSLVMLRIEGMNTPVYVCNLSANWAAPGSLVAPATPEACRALLSAMMAAKASNAVIKDLYFDGDSVPSTCGAFVPQSQVNVRHWLY